MFLTGIKYKVKRKALHKSIQVKKPINVIIVEDESHKQQK